MRFKIVMPVLLLGALVAIAAWLLRPSQNARTEESVPTAQTVASPESTSPARSPQRPTPLASARATAAAKVAPTESANTNQEAYVQTRISELEDLAMDDKPASLQIILSELNNRDPEIRKAAIDAAIQFGSRDAIPSLQAAAEHTDDPQEKTALLEAAEFLKLPSISELSGPAKPSTN